MKELTEEERKQRKYEHKQERALFAGFALMGLASSVQDLGASPASVAMLAWQLAEAMVEAEPEPNATP